MLSSLGSLLCALLPCELAGQWYAQTQQHVVSITDRQIPYVSLTTRQFTPSTQVLRSSDQLSSSALQHAGVHKIAIIGAGAGGSSAAFWLSKAQERSNLSLSVDIYDAANYIGGRKDLFLSSTNPSLYHLPGSTVVYPYDSKNNSAVELGASIFVKANKNMMRAAKEFNLTLNKFADDDDLLGIWDGERFYVKVCPAFLAKQFPSPRI